jgi:hypothetical protein
MTLRNGFLLLALLTSPLVAESLRAPVKGELLPDGPPLVMGLDELVQISLPASTKFTKALEIEVTIPRDVFPYRSNLAVFIYQNFQPGLDQGTSAGDRIGIEVLPPAVKFYLQAPLVPKAGLKAAIDTAVLKLPRFDAAFPLAITILPIDKELPPGYEKFQFSVKVRPMNDNLGALVLTTPSLSDEDRHNLKITANGVDQPSEGPLLLAPGPYNLEVTLPGVGTTTLTAVVTQAKTTEAVVDMAREAPTVVIEAPEGTQVVIDGRRILWKPSVPFPIDLGTHNVQFVIGNTVVSDSFTIDKGGRHRLTLKMSVNLKED